jgi:LPXTG-motif cell wall-anchored protein
MRKRFFVALAAAATLALLPTAAWAHHPLIEGKVDCEGVLTFKATAWEGQGQGEEREKSRTNGDIRITLHTKDGPAEGVEIAKGEFNKENDFSFGGTHDLGLITEEVTIRATAKEPWANGAGPGKPDEAKVKPPTDCGTTTTTTSSTTTTTTPPGDTTTTTTQPEETTTTVPEDTTTTVVPTTIAPPPAAPPAGGSALPQTGASTAPVLLSIAAGLIAAGGTAVYLARRRSGAGAES